MLTPKLTLDRLTINAPRPSRQARGIYASKTADPNRSIRISDEIYESVKLAADILGMTAAEFIKWTAYMSANEVHRIYREQQGIKPAPVAQPVVRVAKPPPIMPKYGKVTRL